MKKNEISLTRTSNGKIYFSLNYALPALLLAAGCSLTPAHAAPRHHAATAMAVTARQQIYATAVQVATADIEQEAKNKDWHDHQANLTVFIPNEVSRYTACQQPLQAALPTGDVRDLARLRYDIRCEDGNGWEVGVTVKPDIYLPVVVAGGTLERGSKISPSDIQMKKRNISSTRDGYITNPDEAVGLSVKRRIHDMQPISPADLEQPILITRGQNVTMLAGQDGIEASTLGQALKKGRKGDLIKVKNLSSNKVVSAVVDSLGVVRMLLAPGQ